MFDAAGIVVTEISTPISAPDLLDVSESTPAAPATAATKKLRKSGWDRKRVSGWSEEVNSAGKASTALKITVASQASAIPTGKPTSKARIDFRARSTRRSTRATDRPARGPNSGP